MKRISMGITATGLVAAAAFLTLALAASPAQAAITPPTGGPMVDPFPPGLFTNPWDKVSGDGALGEYFGEAEGYYELNIQRDDTNRANIRTKNKAEEWYGKLQGPVLTLAAIALIVAGISFAISRGDSDRADKARSAMAAAVSGFLVCVCCYGLVSLFESMVA